MRTKIFFDTEFTGLHQNTTLISIGLVAETDETFYAEFTDYDDKQLNDWLRANVIDKLLYNDFDDLYTDNFIVEEDLKQYRIKANKRLIAQKLRIWLGQFDKIEMWSDCLAYDWVLFNNIFGTAWEIPKNIYYIPFDICNLFHYKGIDPDISREEFAYGETFQEIRHSEPQKHNAMYDATIIKLCYDKLIKL